MDHKSGLGHASADWLLNITQYNYRDFFEVRRPRVTCRHAAGELFHVTLRLPRKGRARGASQLRQTVTNTREKKICCQQESTFRKLSFATIFAIFVDFNIFALTYRTCDVHILTKALWRFESSD